MVYASRRTQALSAAASLAIVIGIAAMLVLGLRVDWQATVASALTTVDVARKPPPREPEQPKPRPSPKSAATDAAAPRNLKNEATQVVAPKIIPLIVPPPVPVTPVAGQGSATNQGAATLPGPGQGAGGIGNGTGGGGLGGDGGGGMAVVGPRQIRGSLSYRDLPEGLLEEGEEAAVGVRYTVRPDGRVSNCVADQPSRFATLNALTCRLIEQRFVFRPARDASGRPTRAAIVERHTWFRRER